MKMVLWWRDLWDFLRFEDLLEVLRPRLFEPQIVQRLVFIDIFIFLKQ